VVACGEPRRTRHHFRRKKRRPPQGAALSSWTDASVQDLREDPQSWDWLVAKYGPVVIHPAAPGPGWRVVEIREDADIAPDDVGATAIAPMVAPTLICKALLADGRPAVDLKVAWYWPDAPEDKAAMPANGLPEGMRPNRAINGLTNLNGDVGLGMGKGSYYFPPEIGPHACWIYGANSEVLFGLGMRGATNHDHLNFTFRQAVEEPPVPEPELSDFQRAVISDAVEALRDKADELAALL
jgi:hypothetical protein